MDEGFKKKKAHCFVFLCVSSVCLLLASFGRKLSSHGYWNVALAIYIILTHAFSKGGRNWRTISKSVLPLDGILSVLTWPWIYLQVGLCGVLFRSGKSVKPQKENVGEIIISLNNILDKIRWTEGRTGVGSIGNKGWSLASSKCVNSKPSQRQSKTNSPWTVCSQFMADRRC